MPSLPWYPFSLEYARHRFTVDSKLGGQLIDGETNSVALNELRDLLVAEFPGEFLTSNPSGIPSHRRLRDPFAQVSKLFRRPGMVRISLDKLHCPGRREQGRAHSYGG